MPRRHRTKPKEKDEFKSTSSTRQQTDREMASYALDSTKADLFSVPVHTMFDDTTTDALTIARYIDHLNHQMEEDLATRPLFLMDDVRVIAIELSRGYTESTEFDSMKLEISRPVSSQVLPFAIHAKAFQDQLIGRMHEKIRPEYMAPRIIYHDFWAALMQSEHAIKLAHPSDLHARRHTKNEISMVLSTLECLRGHEAQFENDLRETNKFIAQTIKNQKIVDVAGECATLTLSNQDRKLRVTVTFPKPFTFGDDLEGRIDEQVCHVLMFARRTQLQRNRNPQNNRLWEGIEKYTLENLTPITTINNIRRLPPSTDRLKLQVQKVDV